MTPYKIKVLDAIYDEESKFLVLYSQFVEQGFFRIVYMQKSDFTYKGNTDFPDSEMHRTAKMWRRFPFLTTIYITDDLNKANLTKEEEARLAATFREEISDEMQKVAQGLCDEAGQVQRKLGRLMDANKLDVKKMLESEIAIRGHMSSSAKKE